MQDAAVAVVFVATIAALYLRPFGLRDWHIAALGGGLAWLIGPLSLREGADVVRDAWNVLAFFLGLMLIAAGAEASGLYERVAVVLARRPGGRPRVLAVLVLGTVITAVLSNDATPLVLTPAIFAAARARGGDPVPAALAATFTADGASLLLPISNPVNLLFYERFGVSFADYSRDILPAAVAGVLALAVVAWLRSPAPGEQRLVPGLPPRAVAPPTFQRAALGVVALLAAAYLAAAITGFPLGLVSLVAGAVMALLAAAFGAITPDYRRHIAPGVLVFVAGLLVLVEAVSAAGLLDQLADVYVHLARQPAIVTVVGAALAATLLANLMNNWPAAVLLTAIIAGTPHQHPQLIAGSLIGCTIGANFTVVGSLSTVFWLTLARARGAVITPGRYARTAFAPTVAALAAACAAAALTLR